MTKFNLTLCKELIKQTRSIDETARLMSDHKNKGDGYRYWRKKIIKHIEKGDLKI